MKIFLKRSIKIFISLLLIGIPLFAKGQYLPNPSFEGPGGENTPPPFWIPCEAANNPDLQPNNVDVFMEASDGNTYISLRVSGADRDNSREIVYSSLFKPITVGNCYQLQVDLAQATEAIYSGILSPSYPTVFKIWGSKHACEIVELLAESPVINHSEWRTYSFTVSPTDTSYSVLYIEPDFVGDSTYHGLLLVDNLRLSDSISEPELVLDTLVWPGSEFYLYPTAGKNYVWQTTSGLSCYNCANPLLTADSEGIYTVNLQDNSGCPLVEAFRISHLSCETAFSDPYELILDTLVEAYSTLTLEAAKGSSYSWSPPELVACAECRKTTINVSSSVELECEVLDSNNCARYNVFRIGMELNYPNVITPNLDGTNDYFVIRGLPEKSEIKIFSRNGTLVYKTNNYSNEWHGQDSKGTDLPEDTYWFTLENETFRVSEGGYIVLKR